MARRGYGEDGIYFDHADDCRDNAHHRTCAGRWRGVVSLGFSADGKRLRKKVSGKTRTEVKDKLRDLHAELDAGVRTQHGYTVARAVADWLTEGLPGRTKKTVDVNKDALGPLLATIGSIPLGGLTAYDVRTALAKMAATHATRTVQTAARPTATPPPAQRRSSLMAGYPNQPSLQTVAAEAWCNARCRRYGRRAAVSMTDSTAPRTGCMPGGGLSAAAPGRMAVSRASPPSRRR